MSEMTPQEVQTLSLDALALVAAASHLDGPKVDELMSSYERTGEMGKLAGNLLAQCVSLLWNYSIATGIPADVILANVVHTIREDNLA